MTKVLVFDLDGTVVDLYGVKNWLAYLVAHDETPYKIAKPLYDMNLLNSILNELKADGWEIVITTWLAKNSNKDYDNRVRKEKLDWLAKYNFPYDEIHMIKYGTTKANCTRKKGGYQVLVDDVASIRNGWTLGDTINAKENIIEELNKLLKGDR